MAVKRIPASASTGFSISVFKRIPSDARIKMTGTTGYPHVL